MSCILKFDFEERGTRMLVNYLILVGSQGTYDSHGTFWRRRLRCSYPFVGSIGVICLREPADFQHPGRREVSRDTSLLAGRREVPISLACWLLALYHKILIMGFSFEQYCIDMIPYRTCTFSVSPKI